jgi:hypothetical protein
VEEKQGSCRNQLTPQLAIVTSFQETFFDVSEPSPTCWSMWPCLPPVRFYKTFVLAQPEIYGEKIVVIVLSGHASTGCLGLFSVGEL